MQCTAKSKQSGQQCKRNAAPGQTKCAMHGAKAPQAVAAAQRRQAEAEATAWMLKHLKDATPMAHLGEVYDELLAVAGTARTMRLVIQQRVSELAGTGYEGATGEQVKADVMLLERALDRSAKVMELIARLDIDERKQRLEDAEVDLLERVVRGILERLDLTPEQSALVPVVVPEQFTLAAQGVAR